MRDLSVGNSFKLFARFKDGTRRPKFRYGAEGTRLHRAYLRVRNHSLGPCSIEITRLPFDFSQELTVVEHMPGRVTMVRDEGFRMAPIYSGLQLQVRTPQKSRINGGPYR